MRSFAFRSIQDQRAELEKRRGSRNCCCLRFPSMLQCSRFHRQTFALKKSPYPLLSLHLHLVSVFLVCFGNSLGCCRCVFFLVSNFWYPLTKRKLWSLPQYPYFTFPFTVLSPVRQLFPSFGVRSKQGSVPWYKAPPNGNFRQVFGVKTAHGDFLGGSSGDFSVQSLFLVHQNPPFCVSYCVCVFFDRGFSEWKKTLSAKNALVSIWELMPVWNGKQEW